MKAWEGRIVRRNAVVSIAAILAVIVLGVAGVYLYRQARPLQLGEGSKPIGGGTTAPAPAPAPVAPEASVPQSQPTPPAEAASAPPGEPMVVPSFDVVLVEPTGEGVFAGRAGPGWKVEIESGGAKIAESTADGQGEWSIILDKKLAPGDHTLSLRTISPDGTRTLTAQQSVPVAIGNAKEQVASVPRPTENMSEPTAQTAASPVGAAAQQSVPAGESEAATGVPSEAPKAVQQLAEAPQSAVPSPQGTPSGGAPQESSAKAPVTFKIVDYQDKGTDGGKMKLSGTSDPGATVQLYFDGKPLVSAKADAAGVWSAEADMKLNEGEHSVKVATEGESANAGQAAITIGRRPVVAKAPEPNPNASSTASSASPQIAAAEDANAASSAARPDVYEIRRGDTLWDIAKRYLGSGMLYTSIFHGNRETIRNPNLILPAQKVKMPPP
jgi:nucleoid-associated protein YgaU